MNIEGEAKEHMMGRGVVDSIKITIVDNGYILEYNKFVDKNGIIDTYEIKKVYTNIDHTLDSIKEICHNT